MPPTKRTAKTLIRLGRRSGWLESLLGTCHFVGLGVLWLSFDCMEMFVEDEWRIQADLFLEFMMDKTQEKWQVMIMVAIEKFISKSPFTQTRCVSAIDWKKRKKKEPYIIQYCLHISEFGVQCEWIIGIYKVLFFPVNRIDASRVIWECAVNRELLTWFASHGVPRHTMRQIWYWTRFRNGT